MVFNDLNVSRFRKSSSRKNSSSNNSSSKSSSSKITAIDLYEFILKEGEVSELTVSQFFSKVQRVLNLSTYKSSMAMKKDSALRVAEAICNVAYLKLKQMLDSNNI